jgi:hypothetical protein
MRVDIMGPSGDVLPDGMGPQSPVTGSNIPGLHPLRSTSGKLVSDYVN